MSVSVFLFVLFDLHIHFFVDVVVVKFPFRLEFVLMRTFQRIVAAFLQMRLVLVKQISQKKKILGFAVSFVVIFSWVCIWFQRCFTLKTFSNILSLAVINITLLSIGVFECEITVLYLLDMISQVLQKNWNSLSPESKTILRTKVKKIVSETFFYTIPAAKNRKKL